jgi:hypothetical protein
MKQQSALYWLVPLIVVLALIAAGVGLLYQDGVSSFSFKTVHGETVQIYGQGLYSFDTSLTAVCYRVGDAITLVLAIPLLIISSVLYRRGSLKGGLLLTGVLAYFLYTYGSLAIGAAYNNLFLIYIVLLSASFFALVSALMSFDPLAVSTCFSKRLPRRGISIYLIVSGVILCLVWLMLSIVPALLQGKAPLEAAYYTTFITGALDLGIIAPALILTGLLLLRRAPLGYLLAPVLLVFTVVLGTGLSAAGIAQLLANLVTTGQFIGFTAGFSMLTLFALWFTVVVFRDLSDQMTPYVAQARSEKPHITNIG